MWNNPAFGIAWKSVVSYINLIINEKDGKYLTFYPNGDFFDINGKWIGA